ncbi:S1 RNA-binding domain-containing transcriptional accessory protein [Desulfuromonas sp. DDH964]|uniref:Tex family protein n=1 Tax=Desulfuromonas sp. DDH964 TaxID=1823759 RepID=UPI00078B2614|nr:Tex family protein [Desulfuromonas sp. DDH964]AMV72883.1 S1 RNA-binding domain-containing transcriptional accessory protein [Desulfuromonas sp. DDH964]
MALSNTKFATILSCLTAETGISGRQVENTVALLREGASVPFIARYRKEQTGELDEVQVRLLEERFSYFSELEERKTTILATISEQGKLSPELKQQILSCRQKTELEDLYLPYKPKRRTKATIARERGLEPLAAQILAQQPPFLPLTELAAPFVDPAAGVADVAAALEGAGHILAEGVSEDAAVRAMTRQLSWEQGIFVSRVDPKQAGAVSKFEMYYDYREPLKTIPSHRMLAMRRGEKEEVLRLSLEAPEEEILRRIRMRIAPRDTPYAPFLGEGVGDAYKRLLAPSIEVDLRLEAKNRADLEAIEVFAGNLRNLLLAPPAGSLRVLGVDPGLRTGSKLAAVDGTGQFLEHVTIYPHTGEGRVPQAKKELLRLVAAHGPQMVAIGNGTAGREMEQFVRETLREAGIALPVVMVSEAGASVYSASEIARVEFPELDLTVRGAISIARRLQDPLAELVKIDPKSIGVGQYQHDVSQTLLKKALDAVVESCVNYVGVDLNTASWALLAYVSGIGETLARNIVRHRDAHGPFADRQGLLQVPRFGAKAFEQAAGFLRIRGGAQPLDNSAVHPERYGLVARMAADLGASLSELTVRPELVAKIDLPRYVDASVGLPTLRDIVEELKKPGRDPRRQFEVVAFRDDVRELTDLQEGMVLPGSVTNVTAFGAFVDVGVHQDGLVHISHLAQRFVKDPHQVVKVGDPVKVKVLSVDIPRKRIALSIKEAQAGGVSEPRRQEKRERPAQGAVDAAAAFEKAGFRVKKR